MSFIEEMREKYKNDDRRVTTYTSSSGQVIVVVGEPNIKSLIKKALAELG